MKAYLKYASSSLVLMKEVSVSSCAQRMELLQVYTPMYTCINVTMVTV